MPVVSCYRSGEIVISRHCAKGAILLVRAPGRRVRTAVNAIARHAYDGRTLLVPGIPEATSDLLAMDAAKAFQGQLRKRLVWAS